MLLLFLGLLGAMCWPRRRKDDSHGAQSLLSVTQGLSMIPVSSTVSEGSRGSVHKGPGWLRVRHRDATQSGMGRARPWSFGQHSPQGAVPCPGWWGSIRPEQHPGPLPVARQSPVPWWPVVTAMYEDKSPTAPQGARNAISTQDPFENLSFLT